MNISEEKSRETTNSLLASLSLKRPRRAVLKGAAATGLVAMGAGAFLLPRGGASAHNITGGNSSPGKAEVAIKQIFDIAVTAERLAVTTYSHAIANAHFLGISGKNLIFLEAALIEEQIHELFFEAAGGRALTSIFSYPHGEDTFRRLNLFIATQQQLESVFDSAFLAAVKEFALIGQPKLAQISAQIACVESEHRALGRNLGGLFPANNWAFAPVLIKSVGDAPKAIAAAGYLSPKFGNSFAYKPVSTVYDDVIFRRPFSVS